MDLKWLKTFIAVYEEGNFRAAAEKLYISQPSITVHIKALEEELQIPLFSRKHTKLALTDAGEFYYPLAKEIISKVEDSKKGLHLFTQHQKIKLVIALSPMLISTILPKIIHDFMQEYPNYEIEILIEESMETNEAIRLKNIDIAIGMLPGKYKGIHAERLLSAPLDLIYPATANPQEKSIDKLLMELFSNYPLFTGYFDEIEPNLAELENEYKIYRKNIINDSIFAIALIKEGLGIGLFPKFQIENELLEGKLKSISLGAVSKIYAIEIYMKHLREEEKLIPLLTYIRERFTYS
ncbi:LysR family transcriptional regulator [Solibacillus silvestris]|uniref:LysR family transcriptional regulator n=1 Tax=Solibacillus silvestris TaxID=76853 RepID=UPI003F801FB3